MPIIQQERGVKTVKGLPARWGRRAYRELSSALKGEGGAQSPRYQALCNLLDEVTAAPLPLDATDAQLCMLAETYANDCASAGTLSGLTDPEELRAVMARICTVRGIKAPACEDADQAVKRCTDAAWWRRNLRKLHGRTFEAAAIRLGFVSVRAGAFASDETVGRRKAQVARNRAALEAVKMENEHGAEYSLAELASKGTSNKRIRRGELMLRLAGCESIAIDLDHVGVFITLTAPSRYHAVLQKSGELNPKYEDFTPRQVQAYLQKTWACARADYGRQGIKPYGFRIAEPHHDGCVHWHALLFMPAGHVEAFSATVRKHALKVGGDEPGAQEQRVKFDLIDSSKGSAAAYIAKYISKNIDDDSEDAHDEVTGADGEAVKIAMPQDGAHKSSQRVDAWAGVWGIRQFQPIGQPPVTVWRELRRVAEAEVKDAPANVRAAWDAVQRIEQTDADGVVTVERVADFGNYIRAQGGVCQGRGYAIGVATEEVTIEGRYGVHRGPAPVGVYAKAAPDAVYTSTRYTWTRTVAGVDVRRSWSPVNNCTDPAWAAHAMPGELVAEFDDAWFQSDEYQKIFVPPEVVGEEWHQAEVSARATRAKTKWTRLSSDNR